jgi:hypothetical protein
MNRARWLIAGAIAVGLIGGGAGIAIATAQTNDDGSDTPITGPALDKAKAAALKHTGGGHVTGTEAGDEEGYYEVEVTMADGRQTDVHLDKGFALLGTETDGRTDGDTRGETEGTGGGGHR